jgi:uncharacterized membrane protein
MIRESLGKNLAEQETGFRLRGKDPGRLENLSDGVFALAITLLLISTSAPTNIIQIKQFAWELIPFSICIVLIMLIWYEHFVFYYRYGLRDATVIVLNTTFLIIVLFYVYPLKFLWTMLTQLVFDKSHFATKFSPSFASVSDVALLMTIYGVGAFSVFLVLALMYSHALKNSAALNLSRIEVFETRVSVTTNLLMAAVPGLSVMLAFVFMNSKNVGEISGFTYFMYMPVMMAHGFYVASKRKKLLMETENAI